MSKTTPSVNDLLRYEAVFGQVRVGDVVTISPDYVEATAHDVARLARYHARDTQRRAHLDAEIKAADLAAERQERRERLAQDTQRLADTREATARILAAGLKRALYTMAGAS